MEVKIRKQHPDPALFYTPHWHHYLRGRIKSYRCSECCCWSEEPTEVCENCNTKMNLEMTEEIM